MPRGFYVPDKRGLGGMYDPSVEQSLGHIFTPNSSTSVTVQENLVAFWPLGTSGALDLNDYVNGLDLTNNGTVVVDDGPNGSVPYGAEFSGSNNLTVADNVLLYPDDSDFAIAAWVRPDGNSVYSVAGQRAAAPNNSYGLLLNALRSQGQCSVDGTATLNVIDSTVTMTTTQWYYAVAWRTGSTLRVNTEFSGYAGVATIGTNSVFDTTANFGIGGSMVGAIAEVALWIGRVPSDTELRFHRAGGLRTILT